MMTNTEIRELAEKYTDLNLRGASDELLYQITGHMKYFHLSRDQVDMIDGWRKAHEARQ